jgi:hypothetical protein
MYAGPAAEQSGRQHLGVIQHKPVAVLEVVRKVAKAAVLPKARGAMDDQHAAAVAGLGGLLGDQTRGQLKMKIGNPHTSL